MKTNEFKEIIWKELGFIPFSLSIQDEYVNIMNEHYGKSCKKYYKALHKLLNNAQTQEEVFFGKESVHTKEDLATLSYIFLSECVENNEPEVKEYFKALCRQVNLQQDELSEELILAERQAIEIFLNPNVDVELKQKLLSAWFLYPELTSDKENIVLSILSAVH